MIVDSHCHLDFKELENDRDGIMRRAAEAGVGVMVTISTRIRDFDKVRGIVEAYDNVFGSVGTHPHNADEELDISPEDIVRLAQHPKIVAIGEAGLDYHYDSSPRNAQVAGFRNHIAASRTTGLPLVIHAREADGDMIRILEDESAKGAFPAVLHCYSSGAELARRGVALGFYVSFSGILTFKNSQNVRDIAMDVPQDRLLVETDAPYLAPAPHRGKTNEPAYTVHTAQVLADIRGWTIEKTARQTTENFARLFTKVPRSALGLDQ